MPYDVTLLGATGFAGGLTAKYLAAHAPDDIRWAIAGRNPGALESLQSELAKVGSAPDVVPVDISDAASVRSAAEQTRVLATTVGPYVEHGEPVVAACAEAGTTYCDLTGESEFVDRMWLRYDALARRTGARLVHACGYDSVPHDLGVLYTVSQLPDDVPITVRGYVTASAGFSGGTYHSAIRGMSRVRRSAGLGDERRKREARPADRRVRALPSRPARGPGGRGWALPMPTIDPAIVRRSARALDAYGPDFRYGQYALFKRLAMAAGTTAGLGGLLVASQVPPLRDALLRFKQPGDGPSEEQRSRSWFRIQFVAEADGVSIETQVSGGDPGYDETARILGESALCLALDDLPERSGQLTTAVAMGEHLLRRLDFAETLDPAR
ncbi:saccharopine dehydrogenase family protein [Solicola gregarius]|uniref:Saccharopine dehydrogenase NADP-binding domain-containing protein n=1 Tax=Solicola gregarius TaxID=2908642 RepID=A0AA46TFC3_9ACTN|nr:saccharopine dehydrogenase NADP-binding domain-containing protein [Solicola gregarius]UYM04291.1 saccharopine dehydrogenase NADP-binding domain-containing protein [Solicola gregarius]